MFEIQQTEFYAKWFSKLKDRQARARINVRIRRLSLGNPGDVKPVKVFPSFVSTMGLVTVYILYSAVQQLSFCWQGATSELKAAIYKTRWR